MAATPAPQGRVTWECLHDTGFRAYRHPAPSLLEKAWLAGAGRTYLNATHREYSLEVMVLLGQQLLQQHPASGRHRAVRRVDRLTGAAWYHRHEPPHDTSRCQCRLCVAGRHGSTRADAAQLRGQRVGGLLVAPTALLLGSSAMCRQFRVSQISGFFVASNVALILCRFGFS